MNIAHVIAIIIHKALLLPSDAHKYTHPILQLYFVKLLYLHLEMKLSKTDRKTVITPASVYVIQVLASFWGHFEIGATSYYCWHLVVIESFNFGHNTTEWQMHVKLLFCSAPKCVPNSSISCLLKQLQKSLKSTGYFIAKYSLKSVWYTYRYRNISN